MTVTNYPGIDYSGPGSKMNRDEETGIRYGMISQHSVSSYVMDDIYTSGNDEGFDATKEELISTLAHRIQSAVSDYGTLEEDAARCIAEDIVDSDDFQWHDSDESGPYSYEDKGVKVLTTSNNELWVFKSPYYTRAQFCSPFVPGAGNLDCFCPEGPKTYCLPADWFEDGKAPYSIWSAETDELVYEQVNQ